MEPPATVTVVIPPEGEIYGSATSCVVSWITRLNRVMTDCFDALHFSTTPDHYPLSWSAKADHPRLLDEQHRVGDHPADRVMTDYFETTSH